NPVETATGPGDMFRATEGRWGSREVEITDVALVGQDGLPAHVFQSGERIDLRIRMRAPLPIDDFVVGIGIFNAEGICCYGTNTTLEELLPERLNGDAEAIFTLDSLDLVEGTYKGGLGRPQEGGLSVRLSPPLVHVSREVAREGRRHLPPAPQLAVLRRRPIQEDRVVTGRVLDRSDLERFVTDARAAGAKIV